MTAIAERPVDDRPTSPERRRPAHRAADGARASTCSGCRTRPAGGRASCATNVTMDAEDLLLRRVPRHPRATRSRAGGPLDPLPAARRRHLGHLPRRPGRPVDHRRGVRRAAAGRRHARRRRTWPRPAASIRAQRRPRGQPGVHPHLAGAVRRVVLGRPAGDAARADLPALAGCRSTSTTGPAGRARPSCRSRSSRTSAGPAAAVRRRRAAHRHDPAARPRTTGRGSRRCFRRARPRAAPLRAAADPARCARPRCAAAAEWIIARQEADGGWGGIQPPWVYSLHGAAPARLPARAPGDQGRHRRPRGLPGARGDRRTARCGGSRPASRRCGTPRWR